MSIAADRIRAALNSEEIRRETDRLLAERECLVESEGKALDSGVDHPLPGRFRTAAEIIAAPPPAEVIRDVVNVGTVGVLVGEPGTSKTFALLDLAAALSEGNHWHGRKIPQAGATAYLGFEGDALGLRLTALQQAGRDVKNLYLLAADRPLSPVVDRQGGETPSEGEQIVTQALADLVADLRAKGEPPVRLVIVDTIRASLAGSEDSSEGVSAYLRAVRRMLSVCPDAGALLAHHAGWQDGETKRKRERGSSAWRGNADCSFYLEGEPTEGGDARLTWKTLKLRDAEKPGPLRLIRHRVELDGVVTSSGFPATSCIILSDAATAADLAAERTQAIVAQDRALDRRILEILRDHDDCTSISRIRAFAGLKQTLVAESLGRLLRQGLVAQPQRQRDPYRVTSSGIEALS